MSIDSPITKPYTPAETDVKKRIMEESGEASIEDFERAYCELQDLYELTSDYRTNTRTLVALLYRIIAYGKNLHGDLDFQAIENNSIISIVETTRSIRNAIAMLQSEYDCDPLTDRNCFNDKNRRSKIIESLRSKTTVAQGPTSDVPRGLRVTENIDAHIAQEIVEVMGANANLFRVAAEKQNNAICNYADDPKRMNIAAVAVMRQSFYHAAAANVSVMRYEGQRSLRRICSSEFDNFLSVYDQVVTHTIEPDHDEVVAEEILTSKKLELDYKILPPGTDLRSFAEAFSEQASESVRPHIDLKRLKVLDDLRQRIGPDKCFFMTGKPSGKSMSDKSGKTIAEDYIGLVIQHHDPDGNVIGEDCVATSPVARKHAGYIIRHDASEGISWRDILQMSKHDASEYFNARSLRFDPAEGKDTYEAFVEKALTLLSCPPEQFGRSYHLAQKKDGTYKMRHRGTGIAKGVLEILKAPHAV